MTEQRQILREAFWLAINLGASNQLLAQLEIFGAGFLMLTADDTCFKDIQPGDQTAAFGALLLREFHKASEIAYARELMRMNWLQKLLSKRAIDDTERWIDELETIVEVLWKEKTNTRTA